MAEGKETVKKERKTKRKLLIVKGKKKEAIARASIRDGTGVIRINGVLISAVSPKVVQDMVKEPLSFTDASKFDIEITVTGGGVMGQAQAARTAVGKAIVQFSGDASLRERMLQYDRSLLVDDPRRVEPKKFKGPKARARFTKSYR